MEDEVVVAVTVDVTRRSEVPAAARVADVVVADMLATQADSPSMALRVAALAMRQVLVNHAREKAALRRSGPDAERVTLSGVPDFDDGHALEVLAVHESLQALEQLDARQARVAELRLFGVRDGQRIVSRRSRSPGRASCPAEVGASMNVLAGEPSLWRGVQDRLDGAVRAALLALLSTGLIGCGSDGRHSPPPDPDPSETCAPPSRLVGQACVFPGIAPDGCGEGFVHDGDVGCDPILPSEPCADGLMAVPGESECQPVMECGDGPWGNIPVDATTVYVAATHVGASDGSSAQPFTTISEAIAAADPGALVAVAAGTYVEDIQIQKSVRLWGVCPEQAVVSGEGLGVGTIDLRVGASGAEIHGLSITGNNTTSVFISGAEGVTLTHLWMHDTTGRGLHVENTLGPTSVSVHRVLVERSHVVGVIVVGAQASVDELVIRDMLPRQADQALGLGMSIETNPNDDSSAEVAIAASLVERIYDAGILVLGSGATIERTVVRDVFPQQSDAFGGRGIVLQADLTTLAVPRLTATHALIERTHAHGFIASSAQAQLEGLVVRDTFPRQSDGLVGRGINIQPDLGTGIPSTVSIIGSVIERSHDLGILVGDSHADLEGVVVRDTLPRQADQFGGRGISIQAIEAPATARLTASLVERGHDVGVFIGGAEVTMDRVVVQQILPRQADGLFGDGVTVVASTAALPGAAVVSDSLIRDNARAGAANFGTQMTLAGATLTCNAIDLAGEAYLAQPFTFDDLGDNVCGCPEPTTACKAISANLAPPEPIGIEP